MKLLVFLFLPLIGCNATLDKVAFREFLLIQSLKEIEDRIKEYDRDLFYKNPTYAFENHSSNLKRIRGSFDYPGRRPMVSFGDHYISNRGRLNFQIKGKKSGDLNEYGVFRTVKDNPVKLGVSINAVRKSVALKITIEDFESRIKYSEEGLSGFFGILLKW